MKVPVKALESLVKKIVDEKLLSENIATDLIPGSEGKLAKYSEKVETFIDKVIKEASDLADEGEELMVSDLTKSTNVGERNRMLLTLVGFLRKLRNGLATSTIDIRKMLG